MHHLVSVRGVSPTALYNLVKLYKLAQNVEGSWCGVYGIIADVQEIERVDKGYGFYMLEMGENGYNWCIWSSRRK